MSLKVWFFAMAQKLTESVTEAHLKLHVPSINGKFLAVSWFAGGFIFVDINLKQLERPQNTLPYFSMLISFVLFFQRSWRKSRSKCPPWQLWLLHNLQLEWFQTKLLDFEILKFPATATFWGLKRTLSTNLKMAFISNLRWDAIISFPSMHNASQEVIKGL